MKNGQKPSAAILSTRSSPSTWSITKYEKIVSKHRPEILRDDATNLNLITHKHKHTHTHTHTPPVRLYLYSATYYSLRIEELSIKFHQKVTNEPKHSYLEIFLGFFCHRGFVIIFHFKGRFAHSFAEYFDSCKLSL